MCFSYVFLGMLPKYTVKPGLFATTCPEALMCLEKTFTSITVKCGIKMTALLSSPEIEGASILNALRMLLACKGLFEYFFGMCVCVCARVCLCLSFIIGSTEPCLVPATLKTLNNSWMTMATRGTIERIEGLVSHCIGAAQVLIEDVNASGLGLTIGGAAGYSNMIADGQTWHPSGSAKTCRSEICVSN